MAYGLTITEAAESDLQSAFFWYEEQQKNLGLTFEKEILKAFESIRKRPKQSQIRYTAVRVYFLKKFPYGIHFEIHDQEILILAVFHTSRDRL